MKHLKHISTDDKLKTLWYIHIVKFSDTIEKQVQTL